MSADGDMTMGWTRLLAAAAGHDINNVAHSLTSLLSLAAGAGVSPQSLAEYLTLASEAAGSLRRLGAELQALAVAGPTAAAQSLQLACDDVVAETDHGDEQQLIAEAIPAEARVRVGAAPLRVAIQTLVRHALAASPRNATVRIVGSSDGRDAALAVVASVPMHRQVPDIAGPLPLASWLMESGKIVRGSFNLVIAGALAAELGGEIVVVPAAGASHGDDEDGGGAGVSFVLRLPLDD